MKVAILYNGPVEDLGWTYEGHQGAVKMADELPYVEFVERENASVAPDTP